MNQNDNTFSGINKGNLEKTILIIKDYTQNLQNIEKLLIEKMDNIKKSILLDGQTIDNKNAEMFQNMKTIKYNNDGSIKVFNNLINKYSEATKTWVKK